MGKEITKEDVERAVKLVSNQISEPKERFIVLKGYCKGINGAKNYGSIMDNLCGHPECYHCRAFEKAFKEAAEDWANKTLGKLLTPEGIKQTIEKYQKELGLTNLKIRTESIMREQVMFPKDIPLKDKYYVGVCLEGDIATIYHDRDLFEEDIVHELLHLANPDKKGQEGEDWINAETEKLIKNNKQ